MALQQAAELQVPASGLRQVRAPGREQEQMGPQRAPGEPQASAGRGTLSASETGAQPVPVQPEPQPAQASGPPEPARQRAQGLASPPVQEPGRASPSWAWLQWWAQVLPEPASPRGPALRLVSRQGPERAPQEPLPGP